MPIFHLHSCYTQVIINNGWLKIILIGTRKLFVLLVQLHSALKNKSENIFTITYSIMKRNIEIFNCA